MLMLATKWLKQFTDEVKKKAIGKNVKNSLSPNPIMVKNYPPKLWFKLRGGGVKKKN